MADAKNETKNYNFGKEMTKVFAINAAASFGAVAGLCAITYVVGKFFDIRDKCNAKKPNLKGV